MLCPLSDLAERREEGIMAAATAIAGTTGAKVGFWRRAGAYIIDVIVLGILGSVISSATSGTNPTDVTASSGLTFVLDTVYFIGLWVYWGGQTLGNKALGIKVVKTDGSAVTLVTAIIRYVGLIISFAVIFIGVIWVAFDANKQGWHDKMAGTYVVKA
jgi:uncharacterized RDD family membrane protein YckC